MDRIDGRRFVIEGPQCRFDDRICRCPERIALVDLARRSILLARQPGAPGRGAARAVAAGPTQNGVGVDQMALGIKAQSTDPTEARRQLGVGDINPTAIGLGRKHRAAIRKNVPVVTRQRRFVDQRVQPCPRNNAHLKACGRVHLLVDARDRESTDGFLLQWSDIRQRPCGQIDAARRLRMRCAGQPARRRGRRRPHEDRLQDSASRHLGQQGLRPFSK